MSKCVKHKFYIFSVKKGFSFIFGTRLVFIGLDESMRLRSFSVPFCNVFAVEGIDPCGCLVFVNRFGFVSCVKVSSVLLNDVFRKKNLLGGIL